MWSLERQGMQTVKSMLENPRGPLLGDIVWHEVRQEAQLSPRDRAMRRFK